MCNINEIYIYLGIGTVYENMIALHFLDQLE